MAIWHDRFPIEYANELSKNTLIENLGIVLEVVGDDYLSARMPVDSRTRQPAGILHGGASVAFAETLASWAATYTVNRKQHYCVGLEINANHLRPVGDGFIGKVKGSGEIEIELDPAGDRILFVYDILPLQITTGSNSWYLMMGVLIGLVLGLILLFIFRRRK